MKVVDDELLSEFRRAGRCELCGLPGHTQPHHVFPRGMGGGGRLDVRVNLVALCLVCHNGFHDGNVPRASLLALVARREKLTVEEVEAEIRRLRNAP